MMTLTLVVILNDADDYGPSCHDAAQTQKQSEEEVVRVKEGYAAKLEELTEKCAKQARRGATPPYTH